MIDDTGRMLICSVCGADSNFGFGVTLEGLRMGDVGDWRCSEHHPTRKASYTREEWAHARAVGLLYPDGDHLGTELPPADQPAQHEAAE